MFYFLLRIVKYDYSISNKQKVVVHLNHHQYRCKNSIIDLSIFFYTYEVFPHVYLRNSTDYFNFIQEMTDFFEWIFTYFFSLIKKKEYINNQLNRKNIYLHTWHTFYLEKLKLKFITIHTNFEFVFKTLWIWSLQFIWPNY